MRYRRLGRSGLQISSLVLGTMNFGKPTEKQEAFRILDAAIDQGINIIDCADVYASGESERILGEAFTRDEWLDTLIRTMGLEPNKFSFRVKLHFLARLFPFVEANYNFTVSVGLSRTTRSKFNEIVVCLHKRKQPCKKV